MTATVLCLVRLQCLVLCALLCVAPVSARAQTLRIVALGAVNTGKGVARSEACPGPAPAGGAGDGPADPPAMVARVAEYGAVGSFASAVIGRPWPITQARHGIVPAL